MMKTMAKTSFVLEAAAVAAMGAGVLAAEPSQCFSDWSVASRIVEKEKLATVAELSSLVRENAAGSIVTTQLCQARGGYVYRLIVKDGKGALKSMTVNARKPFDR